MAREHLSPRQRMINLMYLVFIAMLAMQIDQEILRSFNDTQLSLSSSRLLTQEKNRIFEQTLKEKAQNSPKNFGKAYRDYLTLAQKADALNSFIEQLKTELISKTGYKASTDPADVDFSALNNPDAATAIFFTNGNESKASAKAQQLKKLMDDYRLFIVNTFNGNQHFRTVTSRAKENLITEFPKKVNGKAWLTYKFYSQPLVAALANLEIIQAEARNIQSDALGIMLQEKIDADIKFNAYDAIVVAPNVVLQGQPAQAKVYIGSYDNALPVSISNVDRVTDGQGFRSLNTTQVGEHSITGVINMKTTEGKTVSVPYRHTYTVVTGDKPHIIPMQVGSSLSADKMNVLYRGVQNPVSATMLGIDHKTIQLSAPGATVTGGGGKWNIMPGQGTMVNITISGRAPNGQVQSQTYPFRIKNIPRAEGQVRNANVTAMPGSSVPNQHVTATIPDFDFPVSFTVTGFRVKIPGRGAMFINGSSLSSLRGLTDELRAGDVVNIYDIQATASGIGNQQLKNITPVIINIQ
ncbi:MAG: gliding motility protein GldM [Chryseobacterium sp.]|nr:MAG: gliding motility protein GldM [Chryseobacterium sp.]